MTTLRLLEAVRVLAAAAAVSVLAGCAMPPPQQPASPNFADSAYDADEETRHYTDNHRRHNDERQADAQEDREHERRHRRNRDIVTGLERDVDALSPAVRMPLGVRSGF